MATFNSKPVTVNRPAADIAAKFADLSYMQQVLDEMPADQRAKVGDVTIDSDSINISTKQVGAIKLQVTERAADHVTLNAVGSPVPMTLVINFKSVSADTTELSTSMEVEIPAFLKPMIGGAMQKAVDQFGDLIQRLA